MTRRMARLLGTVVVVVGMFVATVCYLVYSSAATAHDALRTRDLTATAAARRVDTLLSKQQDDERRIGELESGITALIGQLQQAHLTPIVTVPTTTTAAPKRETTTTTTRAVSTTTTSTTAPKSAPTSTTTTTTRPCRTIPVVGRCVP